MKVRETFRKWSAQWPQESRWILWIWTICLVGLLGVGWVAYQKWSRTRDWERAEAAQTVIHAAPQLAAVQELAWVRRSRRADLDFPAEPELWLIAARLLQKVDPEAARRLRRDSEKLRPDYAVIRADFPVPTPISPSADLEFAQASAGTVRGALDYSGWLMVQGRWQDAQGWLARLPATLRDRPELASRRATLFGALRNFDELRISVANGVWGTVDAAAVELAFASRLASQREQPALARDLWRVALAAAGANRGSQAALLHLAVQLGLREQSVQSFERLLTFTEDARATARQFAIWARQQGNPVLWSRVSQLWLEIDPAEAQAYLAELGRSGEMRKPGP